MPILKKIELTNFQSHAHTVLELGDFTAFVGPSSSGKSAVERALSWVFYNDYDQSYPQDAAVPTVCTLTLSDGTTISRMRLGDKNTAKIVPAGVDPDTVQTFKDFGDQIPGVFDLLNARPLTVGKVKLDLNFSRQDPDDKSQANVFLIGESKPAKAQLLGRLYGAHVVNTMLRLMGRDKLEAGRRLKEAEKDEQAARARLVDYAGLPAQEEAVQRARDHIGELTGMISLRGRIDDLRADFEDMRDRRWLTRFDFGVLRTQIGVLKDLAAIRRRRADLLASAAAIADRRWLLVADFTATHRRLADVLALQAVRDRLARAAAAEATLAGRGWLLTADLAGVKAKTATLADLRALHIRSVALVARGLEIRSHRAYGVDTAPVAAKLLSLACLRGLQEAARQSMMKAAPVRQQLADVTGKIADAHRILREQVFAGGECPVCGSDCPSVDAGEVYARINRLVGAVSG